MEELTSPTVRENLLCIGQSKIAEDVITGISELIADPILWNPNRYLTLDTDIQSDMFGYKYQLDTWEKQNGYPGHWTFLKYETIFIVLNLCF